MRGPGYKTSLDIRRTWKCPACGKSRKLMGDVTSMLCECREGGVFMKIEQEKIVAPRPFQQPSQEDVRSSAFGIDDMPVLVPHPASLPPEPTSPRRPRPGSDHAASKSQPITDADPAADQDLPSDSVEATSEPSNEVAPPASQPVEDADDDWGEGIL